MSSVAGPVKSIVPLQPVCYSFRAFLEGAGPSDGIGRRDGLKIRWQQCRVGSSPTSGTRDVEGRERFRPFSCRGAFLHWSGNDRIHGGFLLGGFHTMAPR